MSKKPNSKPKGKPAKSAKPESTVSGISDRTLGVAAIGAVAAVAGAVWFGLFGPLFRAPAADAPGEPAGSPEDRPKDFSEGLTPTAGVAASPAGGTAPVPVVAPDGGHPVPDLAANAPTPGTDRAPEAFRPDPTAPVSPEEREALRPATGPAPSLVEDRGAMRSQTAPANVAES